jgi:hypothetical protein
VDINMDKNLKAYDKSNNKVKIDNFVITQYGYCKVLEIFENNKIGLLDSEGNKIIEYGEKCETFREMNTNE